MKAVSTSYVPIDEKGNKKFSLLNNMKAAGLSGWLALAGFFGSGLVFLGVLYLVPLSSHLTASGRATLAVTLWTIIIWISGAIPVAISGLAIPLLLVISGALPKIPDAFSGFTNDTSFLVVGTFLFAAAMSSVGLDRRIALGLIGKTSKVSSMIRGFFLANIVSALFIPATVARASTYFPVCQGMKELFKGNEAEAKIKKALSIAAVGFSASLGAPLFLTSNMPNVVVASILGQTGLINLTWGKWFIMNFPMLGLSIFIYWWVRKHFQVSKLEISGGAEAIAQAKESLGRMKLTEWIILACFCLAVILWIMEPLHKIKTGMVTLFALLVLFVPGLLPVTWKNLQEKTMWGTWLMLGGSLSLSGALAKTGVAKLIATAAFKYVPHLNAFLVMLVVLLVVQIFRLGIVSSVAAVSLMAPILAALAPMLHINPVPFVLSMTILDPFTFVTPVELASCVVAYGAEDFSFADFFKAGAPVTLMAIAYVLLIMVPWWGFLGYRLW